MHQVEIGASSRSWYSE